MMARMNRAGYRAGYLAGYLKRPALAAITLTMAACGAFGPDREPPKMPSPAHYAVEAQPAQLPLAEAVHRVSEPTVIHRGPVQPHPPRGCDQDMR